MKLKKLHIKNYKSLVDLEIIKPNPFTVFAGPNGAGKSNIFEALEFGSFLHQMSPDSVVRLFGGVEDIITRQNILSSNIEVDNVVLYFSDFRCHFSHRNGYYTYPQELDGIDGYLRLKLAEDVGKVPPNSATTDQKNIFRQFIVLFNRIFIKNSDLVRLKEISSEKLSVDCSNLEKVLKRILEDENKREDITDYMEMMIPGLDRVEIDSNNLSGTDTLLIYEKGINKPFTKDLISDGTYNILCLLTALFQSNEPQFLCIEEPENGLNPYVVQEFVELCRLMCEDHGHYIWLNTHSQTLVRALKEEELILVDKENGATKIKQFEEGAFHGLKADEAWLTNSLGAGIPW